MHHLALSGCLSLAAVPCLHSSSYNDAPATMSEPLLSMMISCACLSWLCAPSYEPYAVPFARVCSSSHSESQADSALA